MDLREALACYTNAVTLEPGDVELICRLAKQWSDLTYEDGVTVEQIQEVNQKAIEYAERAIAMAPQVRILSISAVAQHGGGYALVVVHLLHHPMLQQLVLIIAVWH